jgi:hypothetical protein
MMRHLDTTAVMSNRLVLLVVMVLGAFPACPMASELSVNPTSMAFTSDGNIRMELDVGRVEVVGVAGDKITVSWHSTSPQDERDVTATVQRTGDDAATVVIDGPGNHMRYRVEVPRQSNIAIRMHAGDLDVRGVVGSVDADLLAGNMDLRVADPAHYHKVIASVTLGSLSAPAWRTDTGGILRSLRKSGDGDYDLRASLLAGQLTIRSE